MLRDLLRSTKTPDRKKRNLFVSPKADLPAAKSSTQNY